MFWILSVWYFIKAFKGYQTLGLLSFASVLYILNLSLVYIIKAFKGFFRDCAMHPSEYMRLSKLILSINSSALKGSHPDWNLHLSNWRRKKIYQFLGYYLSMLRKDNGWFTAQMKQIYSCLIEGLSSAEDEKLW